MSVSPPLRTVVVDDDFQVAAVHRAYVERVPGFSVVGEARSGAEALEVVQATAPDLVLLDIYLPDMSGLDVLRELRQPGRPPVHVIAITAARDVETLRGAMGGGVSHYLIKPFRFAALEEKLRSIAAVRSRLARLEEADQVDVDRIFASLRAAGPGVPLPKGLSGATLGSVLGALGEAPVGLTAQEAATAVGMSRVTARRYLDHLCRLGRAQLALRYGTIGRPEHRYRLVS